MPRDRTKPKPAVAYVRRSTDRQKQSIGDQKRAIEGFALKAGYEVLDWYVDDAISGAGVDGREAFQKMIADAQQPDCPFDRVLVYDVKRFGRLDNDETGHFRYVLRKAGVEVVYVAENLSGDDTDDLLLPVKQWQARQELKDLSKVTIRGLLSKVDGGWWMGGTPPFGYDLAYYNGRDEFLMTVRFMPDGTKQVLDDQGRLQRVVQRGERLVVSKQDRARLVLSAPERVGVIQDIFRWYVHEGLGFKGIADRLNRNGVPSPRNGSWSKTHRKDWAMTTIREMLINPVYTGDAVWNRRSFAKFYRISGKAAVPTPKVRRRVIDENAAHDWIVTPDSHPAIVSRSLFDKAKSLRESRKHTCSHAYRGGRGATSNYLLTGVVVCEHCGHNWQGYSTWKGRKRKDGTRPKTEYYACGGYVTKGKSVCERNVIRRDVLEDFVIEFIGEQIRELIDNADQAALRDLLGQYMQGSDEGADVQLAGLRARAEQTRNTINNILDNITETNRDFADVRIRDLKGELADITPQIELLEVQVTATVDLDELAGAMVGYLGEFSQVLAGGTIDERRTVIRAFCKQIRLDPRNGEGRAELFMLPDLTTAAGHEAAAIKSSFPMVAGARIVAEKKTPGHHIRFGWITRRAHHSRRHVVAVVPTRCAGKVCCNPFL